MSSDIYRMQFTMIPIWTLLTSLLFDEESSVMDLLLWSVQKTQR